MREVIVIADCPDDIERNAGLGRGGHWAQFYQMCNNAGMQRPRQYFLTYKFIPRSVYEKMYHKRGLPDTFQKDGQWLPKSLLTDNSFEKLESLLSSIPKSTLVIVVGDITLNHLTGKDSCGRWRGSFLKSKTDHWCLPTYRPSVVLANYALTALQLPDLKRAAKYSLDNYEPIIKVLDQTVCLTEEQAFDSLKQLSSVKTIGNDIETFNKTISCISIATSDTKAYCFPFIRSHGLEVKGIHSQTASVEIIKGIRNVLEGAEMHYGQNYLFDLQYLFRNWCVYPIRSKWFDTMLGGHLLSPMRPKALHELCSFYLPNYTFWKDDRKGDVEDSRLDFAGSPSLWYYNGLDSCNTFELGRELQREIANEGLEQQCEWQMESLKPLLKMMITGIRRDHGAKAKLAKEVGERIQSTKQWLTRAVGFEVNEKSPKQLNEFFYKDLKLPVQLHKKRKNPSTDSDALEALAKIEPLVKPVVRRINYLRSAKNLAAAIEAPVGEDARLRCFYNPGGTGTFRLSSKVSCFGEGTNLQNVTEGEEDDPTDSFKVRPNVRSMFVPDHGFVLFGGDLARADAQVVAWEAEDEELKQAFRSGIDIHRLNASTIYGVPLDRVTPIQRWYAKQGVHACNYDVYKKTLAFTLNLTVHEAEKFKTTWLGAHPKIVDWQNRKKHELETTRTITNIFGYKLRWLDRIDFHAFAAAFAWGPQSTVAIVTQRIMCAWDRELVGPDFQILLQVHDSLDAQIRVSAIERYYPLAKQLAEIVIPFKDPLVIPFDLVRYENSWGSKKLKESEWRGS
jgi:DNA polymerase-1